MSISLNNSLMKLKHVRLSSSADTPIILPGNYDYSSAPMTRMPSPSTRQTNFGWMVSVTDDGETMVVSAPVGGYVSIFNRRSNGTYTESQTIITSPGFGIHSAISGDGSTIAVAYVPDNSTTCFLYAYRKDANGYSQVWGTSGSRTFFGGLQINHDGSRILSSDLSNNVIRLYGESDGSFSLFATYNPIVTNRVFGRANGAKFFDNGFVLLDPSWGAAYPVTRFFDLGGTEVGTRLEVQTASYAGVAISADANTLAFSDGGGKTEIWSRSNVSSPWSKVFSDMYPGPVGGGNGQAGVHISADGSMVFVADDAMCSGSVFSRRTGTWKLEKNLTNFTMKTPGQFGYASALARDKSVAIVGAWNEGVENNTPGIGAIYLVTPDAR